jgi:hypothetical protein
MTISIKPGNSTGRPFILVPASELAFAEGEPRANSLASAPRRVTGAAEAPETASPRHEHK